MIFPAGPKKSMLSLAAIENSIKTRGLRGMNYYTENQVK